MDYNSMNMDLFRTSFSKLTFDWGELLETTLFDGALNSEQCMTEVYLYP